MLVKHPYHNQESGFLLLRTKQHLYFTKKFDIAETV